MDLTDYRRDFARFDSALELARYTIRTQGLPATEIDRVYDRYGHLFQSSTVLELKQIAGDPAHQTGTEMAARRVLSGASIANHLEVATRGFTRACDRCESARVLEWQRRSVALATVPGLLANEAERTDRLELDRRWRRAMRDCAEPRMERLEARSAAALELGFTGSADLWSYARNIDLDRLEQAAAGLLQQTETAYFHGLAKLRDNNAEIRNVAQLEDSDYLRWRRLPRFDRLFPDPLMPVALKTALEWMDLRLDRQTNLRFEVETDPAASSQSDWFRIKPPEDVRLVVTPRDGGWGYRAMFAAAGRALHTAWTSRDIAERHPEFIYAPDRATAAAFGGLFANLHLDRAWVAALYSEGNESAAAEVTSEFALLVLHEVRENCAKLRFWRGWDSAGGTAADGTEGAEAEYAGLLRDATGFTRDGSAYLAEADDDYGMADQLRGLIFESVLLEHLRSRYGRQWWSERKAAEELRDLWNTGSRYSVEELANLLGLGELSIDPLADRLNELVRKS